MNVKLVVLLSLFGLGMAVATVYFIPSSIEPFCWLAIFVVCAWLIATRADGRPFLHGLAVGVLNGVWVTTTHVLLFQQYAARHAAEIEAMRNTPWGDAPRTMMAVTGPVIGIVSGIVLGVMAFGATKIFARRTPSVVA